MVRNFTLRKLRLPENGGVTIKGWRAIFTQLQKPQLPLEELVLWDNDFDVDTVNLLANALGNMTHLKALIFPAAITSPLKAGQIFLMLCKALAAFCRS